MLGPFITTQFPFLQARRNNAANPRPKMIEVRMEPVFVVRSFENDILFMLRNKISPIKIFKQRLRLY